DPMATTQTETAPEPTSTFGELHFHRLLVAVDGSQTADLALSAAVTAARRDHAAITLLAVVPDILLESRRWIPGGPGAPDPRALRSSSPTRPLRPRRALRPPARSETLTTGHRNGRDAMKITYFVSAGMADATRASIPLHLAANGSLELGQTTAIILGGDATELLLGDNAERVEGIGLPPARELLAKLRDHAVPVFV